MQQRTPTIPPSALPACPHPPGPAAAARADLPAVASLQNAYSLLCRTFDSGLAECCAGEGVSLLAYSPLAMGLLSGKYLEPGGGPKEARWVLLGASGCGSSTSAGRMCCSVGWWERSGGRMACRQQQQHECGLAKLSSHVDFLCLWPCRHCRLNRYRGRYAEAESRYGPKPNVHEAGGRPPAWHCLPVARLPACPATAVHLCMALMPPAGHRPLARPALPALSPPLHPAAVAAYCQLAAEWGMSGASLALRFVLDHPLVASAVIGVTSSVQLEELVAAAARPPLDAALAAAVDDIHRRYPNPTP